MCFNQNRAIYILNGKLLKLDKFIYLSKNISFIQRDVHMCIGKRQQLTGYDHMEIWSDKIKWEFFKHVAVLVLLFCCTTWTLMKHFKKNQNGNHTMLQAILNKSYKQQSRKQQPYSHLPPIQKPSQQGKEGMLGTSREARTNL